MGRISQYSSKDGLNRGAWTSLEDKMLIDYVSIHGEGKWNNIAQTIGLRRSGKSCRLRWMNYLKPDIKRGNISEDEEQLIVRLHKLLGNRWSLIAGRLPGRTDNEIKNYWNSTLARRIQPFDFPLPKITISDQSSATPIPPTPQATSVNTGEGDWNQKVVEPTASISGDGEIDPADYNVEDFLDAIEDNSAKEKEEEEKYWDGYYKIGDQFDDQFMDGSDFMSLVPFLDFDQVLNWTELA